MINVKIDITPKEWRALAKFKRTFWSNMTRAMWKAMNVLHTRMIRNLSGPSHSRFPGNGNPFPGVLTGVMRNSVTAIVRQSQGALTGIVGPGREAPYAIAHELGRGVPRRPFLAPTFKSERANVRKILQQGIRESLK